MSREEELLVEVGKEVIEADERRFKDAAKAIITSIANSQKEIMRLNKNIEQRKADLKKLSLDDPDSYSGPMSGQCEPRRM